MLAEYDVWCRDPRVALQNQLGNLDFKDEFDYAPYQKFNAKGKREWKDFMSANWGYEQAVSYCYIFLFDAASDKLIEHYCQRRPNSWRVVCPSHLGERQDHCIRCHWP
jgi:hypothetical protein